MITLKSVLPHCFICVSENHSTNHKARYKSKTVSNYRNPWEKRLSISMMAYHFIPYLTYIFILIAPQCCRNELKTWSSLKKGKRDYHEDLHMRRKTAVRRRICPNRPKYAIGALWRFRFSSLLLMTTMIIVHLFGQYLKRMTESSRQFKIMVEKLAPVMERSGWQDLAGFRRGQTWPWNLSSSAYLQFSRQMRRFCE